MGPTGFDGDVTVPEPLPPFASLGVLNSGGGDGAVEPAVSLIKAAF